MTAGRIKGFTTPDNVKLKISNTRIERMIHPTANAIEKASQAKRKKVRLGNKIYDSIQEVSVALGISPTRVTAWIKNRTTVPFKFVE